jgi:hypothetical protein
MGYNLSASLPSLSQSIPAGTYSLRHYFTSSTTWTCPSGITQVGIVCVGASGGFGGAQQGGRNQGGGGGGGGISFAVVPVSSGTTYSISIGAAGTTGTVTFSQNSSSNNNWAQYWYGNTGNAGGSSSVSGFFYGASGSFTANGGSGGGGAGWVEYPYLGNSGPVQNGAGGSGGSGSTPAISPSTSYTLTGTLPTISGIQNATPGNSLTFSQSGSQNQTGNWANSGGSGSPSGSGYVAIYY